MKKSILEFVNVTMTYEDGYTAVENFNLQINKGEFVTLLGPSGCGKTTMLKIIGGFIYPTRGKILYNGIDIKDMDITKRPTSTVFQDYALFPNMTVRQNIEYGIKLMRTPLENVSKDISVQAEKIYLSAKKFAEHKIVDINKKQKSLQRDINKTLNRYKKNKYLIQIQKMNRPEYLNTLDNLYDKLYEKYGNDYISKITIKNKFCDFINSFLSSFRIPYQLQISVKNMNEIEKEIYELKKWYRYKKPIDDRLSLLNEKYDNLDYSISYWENYADEKREAFEKRHLTRKLNKVEISQKADLAIKMVGLEGRESSYPDDLSGGMKQRVALARSIVIEPQILLLDEPLGALDAKVKSQLQNEIKRLHKELGLTFILVTHDQEEALMLSDKIVVMSNGKIEQIGTPNEIYDTPSNIWVAKFIGRINLFKIKVLSKIEFLFNNKKWPFPKNIVINPKKGEILTMVIRPEDLKITNNVKKSFMQNVKIIDVIYKGLMYDIKCFWNNTYITVESTKKYETNSIVNLELDIEDLHFIRDDNETNN